jgi:hypothetical protein
VFDTYLTQFSYINKVKVDNNNSDNKLVLYKIINPVTLLLIKLSGTKVERYLSKPLLKKSDKKTYAKFWQGASTFYPILGGMACDYSTILASSVPSESVFSIARLQITKRCNRLAPKMIGVILCLRSWGLIEDSKDDDYDKDTNNDDI